MGKIKLSNDDTSSGIYLNISTIIKHLQKFISYTILNDNKKTYFPESTSVEKKINITNLIKNDSEQLIIIGEFLLFLIAISSKINTWIDKIDEMDSEIISKYEFFLEKFFYLSEPETPYPKENSIGSSRESRSTSTFRKSIQGFTLEDYNSESYNKRVNTLNQIDYEREKYQKIINELEKDKNTNLEKLNDANREIEILKESNKQNFGKIEDLMTELLKSAEIKRIYEMKEQEYNESVRSKDSIILNLSEDKNKLLENLEIAKDKAIQMSFVLNENEKLKHKLKEFSILKDKNTENTTLLSTLESKERIIDTLSKENQSLLSKLDKIEEELTSEKKKNLFLYKEHENLIQNFNMLNEDYKRIKKFLDRKSIKIEEEINLNLDEIYSNETNMNERKSHYKKTVRPNTGTLSETPNALITELSEEDENDLDEDKKNSNNCNDNIQKSKKLKKKIESQNFNEKFSFEGSDDESKNENAGITLNSLIGDRISVANNNYLRIKKEPNNFMSVGSFNFLSKKSNDQSI